MFSLFASEKKRKTLTASDSSLSQNSYFTGVDSNFRRFCGMRYRDRSEGTQGGTLPKDTHRQVSSTEYECVFFKLMHV